LRKSAKQEKQGLQQRMVYLEEDKKRRSQGYMSRSNRKKSVKLVNKKEPIMRRLGRTQRRIKRGRGIQFSFFLFGPQNGLSQS